MGWCLRCGKEIGEGSIFCPYCGEKLSSKAFDPTPDPVDEADLRSFVGKNADSYLNKFRRFRRGKEEGFAFTWNWSAFWLGFIWMLYRKMYLWALLAFVVALAPVAYPLTMIGWGITGNYLYYRQARKKTLEYKSRPVISPASLSLDELGGVNRWVWLVGIIFFLFIIFVVTMGFLIVLHFLRVSLFEWPEFIQI
jgi:hypothetical protein